MLNLISTSILPKDIKISYIPGPNFEPVRAILNGCPTPLKFVSYFLIRLLIIGASVGLLSFSWLDISVLKSIIIFLAFSSISSKSFLLMITSFVNIYFELL